MSRPLIITPAAEADLTDARHWYEGKREGLGDEFVLCVEAGLEHIRRVPEAATEVQPGVRRVVVRRFPYGIFYRIDPDQIAVLAVYHSKRNPGDGKNGPKATPRAAELSATWRNSFSQASSPNGVSRATHFESSTSSAVGPGYNSSARHERCERADRSARHRM